jgi:hypothetical protein
MAFQIASETETDADTGDEILYFVRRYYRRIDTIPLVEPIHTLMLRDAKTKRFIRRLIGVELRLFMVVEYTEEEAKKGNPLYVDAVGIRAIEPKSFPDREDELRTIESALSGKVAENFGSYVESELLDTAGQEIGSEIRRDLVGVETVFRGTGARRHLVNVDAPNTRLWYWSLVWKHHKTDAPRSMERTEIF